MIDFVQLGASFLVGLYAPLLAVCVLPLYPAFLAFLSNRVSETKGNKKLYLLFGTIAAIGVITFMLIFGLLFTTFFQIPLTSVINIISPIAFVVLAIVSLLLIFNVDFTKWLPNFNAPTAKHPLLDAFLFGFFFGPIIIPCNPGAIAFFFANLLSSAGGFLSNILNFLAFGIGIGAPLIIFSAISANYSSQIIRFFTLNKRRINLVAGLIMLSISIYELIVVFNIFSFF